VVVSGRGIFANSGFSKVSLHPLSFLFPLVCTPSNHGECVFYFDNGALEGPSITQQRRVSLHYSTWHAQCLSIITKISTVEPLLSHTPDSP
jgi:hypothetical protein